eukprot:gene15272-biopygen7073
MRPRLRPRLSEAEHEAELEVGIEAEAEAEAGAGAGSEAEPAAERPSGDAGGDPRRPPRRPRRRGGPRRRQQHSIDGQQRWRGAHRAAAPRASRPSSALLYLDRAARRGAARRTIQIQKGASAARRGPSPPLPFPASPGHCRSW